jgi:telomere length regulation protein
VQDLPFRPPFIQGITHYISHLDQSVRRCGMLVAEEAARRAGKTLDFSDWAGDDAGAQWARAVRTLLAARDVDADASPPPELDLRELLTDTAIASPPAPTATLAHADEYDSDDSLTGYADADAGASRSPSPTAAELAEIERDPSLNVGRAKVPRPVYLVQLGELVRATSGTQSGEDTQEAERVALALDVAEELVRRKRDYGTELGA